MMVRNERAIDIAVLSDTVDVSSLLTDHHAVEFSMQLSRPDMIVSSR